MWLLCAPAIASPASTPASSGSSPRYSKLRPQRGSRVRLAPPPSSTLNPLALASAPTIAPAAPASFGSQLEARDSPDGRPVAPSPGLGRLATPSEASVSFRHG